MGLQDWSRKRPGPTTTTLKEVFAQAGGGRMIVPSIVAAEAQTGHERDASINQTLEQHEVEESMPLARAREMGRLRAVAQRGSAVDAAVVQCAVRNRANAILTSDVLDIEALVEVAGARIKVLKL